MTVLFDPSQLDVGAAYRDLRERLLAIGQTLTTEEWERRVPHCPEWTIRQTYAHLAGVADDAIHGNLDGVATDPWTKAQVDKRADNTGPGICAEWSSTGPLIDGVATERGLALAQLLFDAVTHEHDIRFAALRPGARDSDALKVGLAFMQARLPQRLGEQGASAQFVVDGYQLFENFSGSLTLTTSLFDAIRTLSSRRSITQILAMDWSSDPSNIVPALLPFAPPSSDLEE